MYYSYGFINTKQRKPPKKTKKKKKPGLIEVNLLFGFTANGK